MPQLNPVANSQDTIRLANNFWSRARQFCEPWHSSIRKWRRYYSFEHYGNQARPNEDRYCLAPWTRILTAELKWIPVGDLDIGDRIIAFEEYPEKNNPFRGQGKSRDFLVAAVENTGRVSLPSVEIELSDGTILVASKEHQWLVPRRSGGVKYAWVRSSELRIGDKFLRLSHTWNEQQDYDAGYLAAAFDGEGCLVSTKTDVRHHVRLGMAQRSNAMLEEVERLLTKFGFSYWISSSKRNDVLSLNIAGRARIWEFLGRFRPKRLLDNQDKIESTVGGDIDILDKPTVVAVRDIGDHEVITLKTSTGTLVAEGFASHNSDPTYTNVVDLAVGIVLANDIEWRAYGFSPSPEEDEDTSHIEKYLAGLWEINDVREGSYQKFDLIQNFMRDGCGVIYSVWDEEIAKRTMDIKPQPDPSSPDGVKLVPVYTESPVRVQVIDPLKVFALPGGPYRWLQIGKVERVSVYDAESIYGKRFPRWGHLTLDHRAQQYGNLIDFWRLAEMDMPVIEATAMPGQETAMPGQMTMPGMQGMTGGPMPGMNQMMGGQQGSMPVPGQFATPAIPPEPAQTRKKYVVQHALVFEDQVIWPLHNTGYDDLPFSIGFFKPVSKDAPKDWGHNIMRPLETTIELLEKLTNRRTRQINTFTSLPMTLQAIAGRPPVQIQGLDMDVLELSQGEEIKFPQWPGSPPDVDRQIDFMLRRAQQSGFSDVAFGSGPSQVAGYALSQLSDTNRIRLEQPVKHLEFLLSQWAQKALKITARYAPDAVIRVYGQLRGKDFVDQVFSPDLADYKVKALIKPEFPNDRVRSHAMATQVRGILSENTIMERYLDIDQPDDEKKRRLRDAAMNHPVMVQYGIINTLMEMAQAGDQAAAMTLQHLLMGQGTGNPEGRPEEPRNNEQMMGVASPTGQPTSQEAGAPPPGQGIGDQMNAMIGASPNMSGQV